MNSGGMAMNIIDNKAKPVLQQRSQNGGSRYLSGQQPLNNGYNNGLQEPAEIRTPYNNIGFENVKSSGQTESHNNSEMRVKNTIVPTHMYTDT